MRHLLYPSVYGTYYPNLLGRIIVCTFLVSFGIFYSSYDSPLDNKLEISFGWIVAAYFGVALVIQEYIHRTHLFLVGRSFRIKSLGLVFLIYFVLCIVIPQLVILASTHVFLAYHQLSPRDTSLFRSSPLFPFEAIVMFNCLLIACHFWFARRYVQVLFIGDGRKTISIPINKVMGIVNRPGQQGIFIITEESSCINLSGTYNEVREIIPILDPRCFKLLAGGVIVNHAFLKKKKLPLNEQALYNKVI